MKFLVRNARGKIIEEAVEKRDALIVTFRVSIDAFFGSLDPFCVEKPLQHFPKNPVPS